jgi:hypothetical protein
MKTRLQKYWQKPKKFKNPINKMSPESAGSG